MGLQAVLYNKTSHRPPRLLAATLTALLVTSLFLLLVGHTLYKYRQIQLREMVRSDVAYVTDFANELQQRMRNLTPLVTMKCNDIIDNLASAAAFSPGVRTYLLVRHGVAYCSSATRTMFLPVKHIYPQLDLSKPLDIRLQQGTPVIQDRPALAAWVASDDVTDGDSGIIMTLDIDPQPYMLFFSRERSISGLALIVKDKAISTFHPDVVDAAQLPPDPAITLQEPTRQRFTVKLYGNPLSNSDISWLISLASLFFALIWVSTYYILTLRARADRDILRGIRQHEFYLVYQPVIDLDEMRIGGLEILIRWQHPRQGLIPPDQFIPYCEAQGLIAPLTRYIFEQAVKEVHQLVAVLPDDVKIGVNIAPSHLTDPDFRTDMRHFLDSLPQDHFQTVVEITERSMVQHGEAEEIFRWLKLQGVEIAIDDFGTGHSALIYLERYKIDYLKIDRGFIHSIGMNTVTAPVLDAVLSLAQKLDLQAVAEGVENEEQTDYLRKRGVRYVQGYLYCRPLPLTGLLDFIHRWNKETA